MIQNDQLGEISPQPDEPRASFLLLSFLIALFATAFFVDTVDWQVSTYDDFAVAPDEAEEGIIADKGSRKIAYTAIGMAGILMLLAPGRRRVRLDSLPVALLCLYFVLCIASILWTDVPWSTIKQLGIATFGLLGTFGVARHLSLRDVIDLALGIGVALLVIGLYAELRLGTFTPWANGYRFSGIVHPNAQGTICGVMVIAALFGIKTSDRYQLVYVGLLLLAGTFLLLTKSRTSIVGCLCAVSAAWYLGTARNKQIFLGFGLPAAVCAGLIVLLLLETELASSATTAASFGRDSENDLLTFNGRIPLWSSLLECVAQRPLLGYGYQGFWTETRHYEVSLDNDWAPASAHSTPMEVLLNTGLLGGFIFALGVLASFRIVIKRCLETKAPTNVMVFAFLVYALIGSCFESSLSQPGGFESFITGVALLQVLSRRTQIEAITETIARPDHLRSDWKAIPPGGLA